ncbi:MAG: DUF222 domain-containing protein [Acidimicrobiales bacterium]
MTIDNQAHIAQITALLRDIDINNADERQLETTTAGLRTCQRLIDAKLVAIATQAKRLHDQGKAGTPDDVLGASGDVTNNTSNRDSNRAETASKNPLLGQALNNGTIGGEHLDLYAKHTRNLTDDELANLDNDAVANAAEASDPDTFGRTLRGLVRNAKRDGGQADANQKRDRSYFRMWFDHADGMGRISGAFDPERFSQIRAAIDNETTALANDRKADDGPVTKDDRLAADALVSLLERGGRSTTGAARASLHVHIDFDTATSGPHDNTMCETSDGAHVPPRSLQRLLCDSLLDSVVFRDGDAINVGRRYRTATDKQWSTLRSLYRSCAWDGCQRPLEHCQAHHVKYWEHGGLTDLDNLVPLCSHHHHRIHDLGWDVKLLPDRQLKLYRPDGVLWRITTPDRIPPDRARTRGHAVSSPGTSPPQTAYERVG